MSLMPMKQTGYGVPIDGGYGLPDDVYKTRAERKRKLAEALRKESTAPQGQMISGHYVAPSITQYLASGLKGYKANQMEKEAETEWETGAKQQQARVTSAQQKYLEALRPQSVQTGETKQPFESSQMDRFGTPMQGQQQQTTPVMGQRQPTPEELYAAQMQFATDLNDPQAMMQAANSRMGYMEKQQTREDDQLFKQEQAQLQREQIAANLQAQIQAANQRGEDTRQMQYTLAQMNNDARRDMAAISASNRPEKMLSVMGPDGTAVLMPQSQAQGMTPYNPGVAKQMKLKETTGKAKNEVNQIVDQLGSAYSTLKDQGGITSANGGLMGNLGAMASNTGVGQLMGRAGGTQNQQARDTIAQTRPLLLNAIKNATGMSAQQMNSNAEMQLYLRAATDPSLGYEANAKALENLDKLYGLGMYKGVAGQQQSGTIKPPPGAVRRKN
jgi:hypothetical protein